MIIAVKMPKYSGQSSWESFPVHAQFQLLAESEGWTEEAEDPGTTGPCPTEATVSTVSYGGCTVLPATAVLLGAEELQVVGRGSEKEFGQCDQPSIFQNKLYGRWRRVGEFLRSLTNDIESLAECAYTHMPPWCTV